MRVKISWSFLTVLLFALCIFHSMARPVLAAVSKTDPPSKSPLGTAGKPTSDYQGNVQNRVKAVLDNIDSTNDYEAAKKSLQSIFDETVYYARSDAPEAMREADIAASDDAHTAHGLAVWCNRADSANTIHPGYAGRIDCRL